MGIWPAWMFYHGAAMCGGWLRLQRISLPTVANRNQKNGGIIGESKIGILKRSWRPPRNALQTDT